MKQRVKKTYTFADQTVNLHGYRATCTETGNSKQFHHAYLANLIVKKYNNDFGLFEKTYVSKEGRGLVRTREAAERATLRKDRELQREELKQARTDAVRKYKQLKRFFRHIRDYRGETKYLDSLPNRQSEFVELQLQKVA